ncbi:hypothetical protein ACSS6W_008174 [Trichoderma asperelloides]
MHGGVRLHRSVDYGSFRLLLHVIASTSIPSSYSYRAGQTPLAQTRGTVDYGEPEPA